MDAYTDLHVGRGGHDSSGLRVADLVKTGNFTYELSGSWSSPTLLALD